MIAGVVFLARNSSVTSIAVVQSGVLLTIDDFSDQDLTAGAGIGTPMTPAAKSIVGRWPVLVILAVVSCSPRAERPASTKVPALDRETLHALLDQITPWPWGEPTYSQESWERLLSAARYIDKCRPSSVASALRQYEAECPFRSADAGADRSVSPADLAALDETLENDTKILLLMRVLFELPERSTNLPKFHPWALAGPDRNADGTVNSAWPIVWRGGAPRLIAGQTGIEGVVDLYRPAAEYEFFRARFHRRQLQ